jgi:hypothetical protein
LIAIREQGMNPCGDDMVWCTTGFSLEMSDGSLGFLTVLHGSSTCMMRRAIASRLPSYNYSGNMGLGAHGLAPKCKFGPPIRGLTSLPTSLIGSLIVSV